MRIVEIILGLGMIACAIFLGISTYKTHFRKKSTTTTAPARSDSPATGDASVDNVDQSDNG